MKHQDKTLDHKIHFNRPLKDTFNHIIFRYYEYDCIPVPSIFQSALCRWPIKYNGFEISLRSIPNIRSSPWKTAWEFSAKIGAWHASNSDSESAAKLLRRDPTKDCPKVATTSKRWLHRVSLIFQLNYSVKDY